MSKLRIISISKYIITALSIIIVAVLGSVFVNLGMDWYSSVNKPSMWVPSFVFPIVWSVIYVVFGAILFSLIKNNKLNIKLTILFILNGIINILWCLVFFTLANPIVGLVLIIANVLLAVMLVYNILSKGNAWYYFSLIYPLWVSIATTLNLAIWILN